MHELSLALAVLDQIEVAVQGDAAGRQEPAAKVQTIVLRHGPLAGVCRDAFQSAFELAASGTRAEGAELKFLDAPVAMRCDACSYITQAERVVYECGQCGSKNVRLSGGSEFMLEEIEVL